MCQENLAQELGFIFDPFQEEFGKFGIEAKRGHFWPPGGVFLGTVFHEWASLPVHDRAGSDVRTIRLSGGSSIGESRSRQIAGLRHRC